MVIICEIKREFAGIFNIKSGSEVNIPKVEIKREVGVASLARSVEVNDEFVEEEMEKIAPVSGVDKFLEEEKENIHPVSGVDKSVKEIKGNRRNYSKETFDDRRVVAESFFDDL